MVLPALDVNGPAIRGALIQTILEGRGFPIAKQKPATFIDLPKDYRCSAASIGLILGDSITADATLKNAPSQDSKRLVLTVVFGATMP